MRGIDARHLCKMVEPDRGWGDAPADESRGGGGGGGDEDVVWGRPGLPSAGLLSRCGRVSWRQCSGPKVC